MSDRELLELAAKAAGIERAADRLDSGVSITLPDGLHQSLPKWNPLTDDGDALRLAVKLSIVVNCWLEARKSYAGDVDGNGITESHSGSGPYAATRRAIVRAAATIGEPK